MCGVGCFNNEHKRLPLYCSDVRHQPYSAEDIYPIILAYIYSCTQAPPGVKKNLQRTYESWSPEYITKGGNSIRAQALFALAWFHAVVQERRNFIPQVSNNHNICYHQWYIDQSNCCNQVKIMGTDRVV